jgi:hypothetical protein
VNSKCRFAPASVRRQLREEAGFGCAFCGNPLIENAHIIPYSKTKDFKIEDMVALCPGCHTEADLSKIPEWVLRDKKSNPFNRDKSFVKKKFTVTGEQMVVNIGSNRIIDTENILVVNNFNLISIRRLEKQYLSISVNLFDKIQRRIAFIHENEWFVDKRYFWDIEYRPQHLILRNAPKEIIFEIQISDDEIFITGNMFFNGFPIIIRPNTLIIAGFQFMGMTMYGARVGISCSV